MAMFKIVIPLEKGKAVQVEKDVPTLAGMKIGDKFDGSIIGLTGYTLQITGGSDKEGFPMRRDLPGTARKRALLTGGVGCKPKGNGTRVIKTIRGNRVGEDIVQVNLKVAEKGKEPVEKLLGLEKKPEEGKPKEKAPKEEEAPEKEEPEEKEPAKEEKPEEKPDSVEKPDEKKEAGKPEKDPGAEEKKE
ncbi:MAG: 30S ribosomal protein S6e [archaeon]|nr:MAG: 30S ribosomal protein S6e [archaeon]